MFILSKTFFIGSVASRHFPENYPNHLRQHETIHVKKELLISLHFTEFNITESSLCHAHHLTIEDSDGTLLMEKRCGSSLPAVISSSTSVVNLFFSTSHLRTRSGWHISWTSMTEGKGRYLQENGHMLMPTG